VASSFAVFMLITAFAWPNPSYGARLPLDFSIGRPELSDLPVTVGPIDDCGCWSGPRGQAEKKLRFSVRNNSREMLDLASGVTSAVRLLVAYPKSFKPLITMPTSDHSTEATAANPGDITLWASTGTSRITPSKLSDGGAIFGISGNYDVYALPANPNKIIESSSAFGEGQADGLGGYATVVDTALLPPGRSYASNGVPGHGDWVFYVPLEPDWAELFAPSEFEPVVDQEEIAKHVVVIGIGIFSKAHDLIGFAPAPPESEVLDPSTF
jgi:hypothetical protein